MIDCNRFQLIDMLLTDYSWLEVLCDMEELGASPELLRIQLKCRPHLMMEKRALGLEHLAQIN